VNIRTVAYKGSKRKLLENIEHYAKEIDAQSFFDGFSGTGIVGAYMRSKGYVVQANDMNHSSYIYGKVFLRGFDQDVVDHHLEAMNNIDPKAGWLTENYSGSVFRRVRGAGTKALGEVSFIIEKNHVPRAFPPETVLRSNGNKYKTKQWAFIPRWGCDSLPVTPLLQHRVSLLAVEVEACSDGDTSNVEANSSFSFVGKRNIDGVTLKNMNPISGGAFHNTERPRGYARENAMLIDSAREYIKGLMDISEDNRNALIFSIILAADKVYNNSNDQKSALKEWTAGSLKKVEFVSPTLIEGLKGEQHSGDIIGMKLKSDLVYLDPPYTHGVLYASCYHLSDSIAKWNKPELDHSYAIPRPLAVCYRKNGETAGGFYNKESAAKAFHKIIGDADCKRVLLSYSDAPRNTLTMGELVDICSNYGTVRVDTKDHRLCMQPKNMRKISTSLKEFFIIIDKKGDR
tara:strand:- start:1 stop:1374 length:1374 start_codon:yes stop_codon:yes gene_type:complete